jgi:GNAT superfamily N-acetyltransferase
MPATFRAYQDDTRLGADYHRLRAFLIEADNTNYAFGRWDWMITHSYLDATGLPKIGLWEDGGKLVAAATYDCALGKAYLLTLPGWEALKAEMLQYAPALAKEGAVSVLILDGDARMQDMAARHGFRPTTDKESEAVYPIGDPANIRYTLPEGFSIVSMADRYDPYQYLKVLWKGFDHEADGEGPFTPAEADGPLGAAEFRRPNVDLSLKIAVVAPNGDFAAYCGMWQDPGTPNALVEPVATDPAYRKMGLGRAAVLEAVRRCAHKGAKRAWVGSRQQFYYSIGFRPWTTSTFWEKKLSKN